jgi:hypothetical protein
MVSYKCMFSPSGISRELHRNPFRLRRFRFRVRVGVLCDCFFPHSPLKCTLYGFPPFFPKPLRYKGIVCPKFSFLVSFFACSSALISFSSYIFFFFCWFTLNELSCASAVVRWVWISLPCKLGCIRSLGYVRLRSVRYIYLDRIWFFFVVIVVFPYVLKAGTSDRIFSRVSWLYTGSGLVFGLIGLLKLVSTNNYSAIVTSHNLQFAIARTNSSMSSLGVAW